jgi:hypothetical protein
MEQPLDFSTSDSDKENYNVNLYPRFACINNSLRAHVLDNLDLEFSTSATESEEENEDPTEDDVCETMPLMLDKSNLANIFGKRERKAYVRTAQVNRREPRTKRQVKALDIDNIQGLRKLNCTCGNHCFRNFTPHKIRAKREAYHQLSTQNKKAYLVQELTRDCVRQPETDSVHFRYYLGNTQICAVAYEKIWPVSRPVMVEVRSLVKLKKTISPTRRKATATGTSPLRLFFRS